MDKYENNSELVQLKIPMIRFTSPNQLEACQNSDSIAKGHKNGVLRIGNLSELLASLATKLHPRHQD